MKVEILHIEDCPNWVEAGERVRSALDDSGHRGVEIEFRLLRTSDEAAEVPFAGSPTILVDDVDAFPSDGRATDLACRIYWIGGRPAGLPSPEQLQRRFADGRDDREE